MRPERIGRYTIERTLGVGGMGTVYLGHDPDLDRPVAIKGLLGVDATPERRERLRREALATAALSHPGIAHVYEIVAEGSQDWLVMEYVEGTDLAAIVAQSPLPSDQVARIGRAVASALSAAHRHGVIHRDIKPDNVMIGSDGTVKVLDFGLALRDTDTADGVRLTSEGMVVGTAKSMSPEQALGRPTDARSDIFSLGSLMVELATGHPAFSGDGPMDIMVRVAHNDRQPVRKLAPTLAPGLVEIVERCMATRPEDRFQTAAELVTAFDRLDGGTGATSILTTLGARARTLRSRWAIGLAAGVAVTLLAFAATRLGWLSPRPPLTVAVLPVTVQGGSGPGLISAAIVDAISSHLARLDHVSVVSGREVRAAAADDPDPVRIAEQLGVRELVSATVLPRPGGTVDVTLRRIDGGTGRETWQSQLVVGTDNLLILEDRITTTLAAAYKGFGLSGDTARRDVTPAALEAYLSADARITAGTVSPDYREEIALLDRAVKEAPRFVKALTTLAAIQRYLYEMTGDEGHLRAAEDAVARAQAIAPDDPDVLARRIELTDALGQTDQALALAQRYVSLQPGSEDSWRMLGRTLTNAGRLSEAEAAYERSIALRPQWQAIAGLADVRKFRGDYAGAREVLARLLAKSPDNVGGRRKLGEVEMLAGNFAVAESLFRGLLDRGSLWDATNLGTCVFFQGRYEEAAQLYRRVAEAYPTDPMAISNLADALLYSGQRPAAEVQYTHALALCQGELRSGRHTVRTLQIDARCLAQLGRGDEATLIVQEAIEKAPENPETLFTAALVAALAGNRASCLAWTERALARHAAPAWFAGPEFGPLHADPAFRRLFARPPWEPEGAREQSAAR